MRHQRTMKKFGRSTAHRKAMMKNMAANLILRDTIVTTLPKAKQLRKDAEKLVTIARKGTLAARRLAASRLFQPKAVQRLFDTIAPSMAGRNGGYTRIVKNGTRKGDGAPMAIIQWVNAPEAAAAAPAAEPAASEAK